MNELSFLESVKSMPLMNLPVRSTVVRLKSGSILISPGSRLKPEQLQSLKSVTDIVAPNLLHTAGVPQASEIFPEARTWGAPGARNAKKKIAWYTELSVDKWPYQNELTMIPVRGMPSISEMVFIHQKSRSLIVTDLCFNMVDQEGLGPKLILSMFGTYKKFGISKLFLSRLKDKSAFKKSMDEILRHDFENIIVSHGHNVIGHGRNLFKKALEERGY